MPYFSNKPAPTPGHLLPRPKTPCPDANKKEEEASLKRKIFDSFPDSGDGSMQLRVDLTLRVVLLSCIKRM